MLRSIEELEKCDVQANDGPIGHVRDFYFDDHSWVVRYIVVDTGGWLSGRKVLISPISIGLVDLEKKHLQVLLDREKIKNSPDFDSDMSVSRQHEMRYFDYYGYPVYWGGAGLWGDGSFPSLMLSDIDSRADGGTAEAQQRQRTDPSRPNEPGKAHSSAGESAPAALDDSASVRHEDPDLRSCKSVLHYEIHATDGLIGHVEGFLVDDETWAIRHLIVKNSHWWLGHRVLINPDRVTSVNWLESTVRVAVSRAAVKESPPFEPAEALDHEPQGELYKHRDRSSHRTNQS